MKKNLIPMLLLAIWASSCSQDELVNEEQTALQQGRVYTASFEESDTRTYVNEEGKLRWTADDRISIFECNTYNREFKFNGETGANSGDFSPLGTSYSTGNKLTATYAVYPYNETTAISDDGVLTVTFPFRTGLCGKLFRLGSQYDGGCNERYRGYLLGL
ncbi:MAG: hypothetical protein IJ511_09230 [Bacteroides sp.]|nr:hypothetical protein [Bacteroides sp.]